MSTRSLRRFFSPFDRALTMPAWTDEEISRLRRRFVGADEDFGKVLVCVQTVWTAADLAKLESSRGFVAWDAYFKREKVIAGGSKVDYP